MRIKDRIDFFVGDNASSNDTAIRAILGKLRPDIEDPDSGRVRCCGHYINLAAKAFLFGRFEAVRELSHVSLKVSHVVVRLLFRPSP